MTRKKQKLELTWVGKEQMSRLEPRILIEDNELSFHAKARISDSDIFENILVRGDNLLALKALESEYTGKIKCIYIDPPYNSGKAFLRYDDGLEHSLWLQLMRDRLEILARLLHPEGVFFAQVDDREGHYLKVVCDEIFGRSNFVATFIWRKVDSPNDNKVPVTPDHEFILAYSKSSEGLGLKQKPDPSLLGAYRGPDQDGKYYRDRLLKKNGKNSLREDRPTMWFPVVGPDDVEVYPIHDDGREARWAASANTVKQLQQNGELIWKNRGSDSEPRWVPYTREFAKDEPTRPYPSIWTDLPTTRQTKAHQKEIFGVGNEFETPKPEQLIERILMMCTNEGDLVLDSFGGSGTTGAVAHKMKRRWIMVELGDHCHTHIVPRLKKVIGHADAGGVTESVGWQGGGGFRYYHLAPSLLEKDKYGNWVISRKYNANMLAEAVCKNMGFVYAPAQEESEYWRHGQSTETDFIFVTTSSMTHAALSKLSEDVGSQRTLLICCPAFNANPDSFENLTIRKIPHAVLAKCEWGRDDYSLNVESLPMIQVDSQSEQITDSLPLFGNESS